MLLRAYVAEHWPSSYLVVELSDVLLNVWQKASEGKLLDELSNPIMVIEGQTCTMTP